MPELLTCETVETADFYPCKNKRSQKQCTRCVGRQRTTACFICSHVIYTVTNGAFFQFGARAGLRYLDVVVDASRENLITGVIEGHSQHLVGVLEGVDGPFLTNVPQLHKHFCNFRYRFFSL